MRRILASALVGGLALTACGGAASDGGTKSLPAKRTASRQTTTTTAASFVDATTHTPGTLKHYEGARSDVHDTTCTAEDGAWSAEGKVTNSAPAAARYRIYVSFLSGDTTVGIAETAAGPVRAGATADWSARVKAHDAGLRCILRVERADA
jgi:hypothetical protein